jgi:N-acetyl-gamma-glutamylphosphate reductase
MTFFKSIFTDKLAALRAAAPRATLRMLHESNGFSLFLDEAAAARKVSQLGTLTDYAEDILEDGTPTLFIPLEQTMKFVDEVTAVHSVAFVDVCLANRVNNARHTMYAYFPKRQAKRETSAWPYTAAEQAEIDEEIRKAMPVEESDDFWG